MECIPSYPRSRAYDSDVKKVTDINGTSYNNIYEFYTLVDFKTY